MSEITPEQQKQLDSWAIQRDTILKEISDANTEKDNLTKGNIILAESNTEISNKVQQSVGRLEELDKKEVERKNLVSTDLLVLEKQKTTLESSITSLSGDVRDLILQKNDLIILIKFLTETHKEIFDRTGILQEVIGHVKKISEGHISDLNIFFNTLKKNIQEIIDLNSENTKQTKIVLEKLPLAILQFRRPTQIIRPVLNKRRDPEQLKEIEEVESLEN